MVESNYFTLSHSNLEIFLSSLEKNGYEIITSTLKLGEILTKPYKDFFSEMELLELNSEIASLFAKVRADYKIKTPDSVQLASAVYAKADWGCGDWWVDCWDFYDAGFYSSCVCLGCG